MRIELDNCVVRSWELSDAASIAKYANNRKIWLHLRDAFPHPYTLDDAQRFLARVTTMEPETYFAIAVGQEAVGSIGYGLRDDVERCSAEIGYWVAEPFWGRGIATAALRAVTQYAMQTHDLTRVYALPFDGNPASCRALEKAGFVLEGRMRKSAIKDGKILDQLLYARVS
ncbi:MAG: GNAT family N-acetyltransferase [Gemmatimonadales bacterium]|nr:GNAT family N-acetyltransferase [Gemmatimonadales bacterium]NIR01212.1 GNAT family N-acetyltransferase [Gemmatimonadales bacterium]NIS65235.1 GNAT family N-acetyltransferase [Gemmatimonadales bacterium]